jgi:preprotein translocase subunit Sec61beta
MKEIRITPRVQLGMLLALASIVIAALVAEAPELRRYLKIESM